MRKIIKSILVYATIAMIVCCSFFVTAFAASADVAISPYKSNDNQVYHRFTWIDHSGSYARIYMLPTGEYTIDTLFDLSSVSDLGLSGFNVVSWYDATNQKWIAVDSVDYVRFVVTEDMLNSNFGVADRCMLVVNCTGCTPAVYPYRYAEDTTTGVYYQVFDVFARFIYGEGAVLTSDQSLVLTILATAAVLFVIAAPFVIVARIFCFR